MLCQNKPHLKAIAVSLGIPVALGAAFRLDAITPPRIPLGMKPPFFVKPARLDNSIGDQLAEPLCHNHELALTAVAQLMAAGIDEVMVEEFLPGDEFSVVAANGGTWQAECAKICYTGRYFDSIAKDSDAYVCEFSHDDRCTAMVEQAVRFDSGFVHSLRSETAWLPRADASGGLFSRRKCSSGSLNSTNDFCFSMLENRPKKDPVEGQSRQ